MTKKKEPEVVERRQAMIGDILAIQVPPGTPVHDFQTGALLGHVWNRHPVKVGTHAIYLSTDDFNAAEAVLPKPKKIIH